MARLKARLAASLYPRHLPLIDQLNANARVAQWIRQHRAETRLFDTREELHAYVNGELCGGGAIDYLEFGVYRGESMRHWAAINRDAASRFIGFDSFEGLPEDWTVRLKSGAFDTGGVLPEIDDGRVSFVKGWFQDTLPTLLAEFQPRSTLVIHNDSDLYSSTLYVLTMLDRLLAPGSVVIFDEFSSPLHEFRAFHDYLAAYRRQVVPVAMTRDYATQVAVQFR